MTLVNIARDDAKPYFVDADDITGIHQHVSDEGGKRKNELSIYNSKGQLAWLNADSFNLDAETAVAKLREAGVPMVKFPIRWPDGEGFREYVHFINPEAVTFATVSSPGRDGEIGAIVGVKGVGWEESYGTRPEELEELMNTVRAVKTLETFTPDIAEARWAGASMLYIDTKSVVKVRDDGYQVNVDFIGSGSLDVQIPRADVNDFINQVSAPPGDDVANWPVILKEATMLAERASAQARHDFAAVAASGNPALIDLSTPSQAVFITKEAVGSVSFYDDEKNGSMLLRIAPQKLHTSHYPDTLTLRFNTAAERQEVMDRLLPKTPKAPGFEP